MGILGKMFNIYYISFFHSEQRGAEILGSFWSIVARDWITQQNNTFCIFLWDYYKDHWQVHDVFSFSNHTDWQVIYEHFGELGSDSVKMPKIFRETSHADKTKYNYF